jgi:hypothetical protein
MPDLELSVSVSDVSDDRRSRRLTVIETPSRSILDVLRSQAVGKLTKHVLPGYLMERRWYAPRIQAFRMSALRIASRWVRATTQSS